MPIGPYKDFAACHAAMMSKGKDSESAKKICGEMESRMHGGSLSNEIYEENNKLYIKAFLLDSSINQNAWGVDSATLDDNINSYIGKPLVLQDDFEHPNSGDSNYDHNLQYQEKFRIGNIIDVVKKDSIYSAIIEVTDPIAKQAFKAGDLPLYVSPQLFHDGVGKEPDDAARTWRGTHLAVVKEPAFGIMKARIEGQCSGSPMACLAQLKRASVDKSHCNCVKQAIANFKSKFSSLENLSLTKSKLDSPTNNAIPQISNEDFEKIQRERDELKAKVAALEGTNNKLTEENKTVSASLDSLKGEYRKDKITSILSNVFYKTDEERAQNIDTFTKSGMTYEEVERVTSPLKKASVTKSEESKLPVKSAASEDNESNEVPYWVRINQHVVGATY